MISDKGKQPNFRCKNFVYKINITSNPIKNIGGCITVTQ